MTGNEIRTAFIQYFESKGHKHVRSSSLVPHNDPTILFTNAGMNQFKDYFLGNQVPEFTRAVTSQKVVRAGGKHNDLENVGRTDRHHTFFEMLGNFSFGDYFKKDAIQYGWEFLTKVLGLPADLLAVSVFENDDEAFDLWHQMIGIPKDRIARLGEKDNFWAMGDTGPCGPCSEIHYRMKDHPGRTAVDCLEADDGSYLEIWNLVFMQFNRNADGTMQPLPKPSIDTGAGLERVAAVVQGKRSNYDSDILSNLVGLIANKAGYQLGKREEGDVNCRVIADHIRASTFLISDGVIPSNEGRGYVLRRIIRRAARHGKELGFAPGFFSALVADFVPLMQDAYPKIAEDQDYISILLKQEELRFTSTLNQGMRILDGMLADLKAQGKTQAQGEEIFKLYDTYGFPVDLAQDILEDHGFTYDKPGFEQAMEEQRRRAKEAQDSNKVDLKVSEHYLSLLQEGKKAQFVGYQQLQVESRILAVLKGGQRVKSLKQGDQVEVLLEKTPFYAESGGQVGSKGEIMAEEFRIRIDDCQSPAPGLNIALGQVVNCTLAQVDLKEGHKVTAQAEERIRRQTENNHTATHLLQAALRLVLGDHVKQSGSFVSEEKLRFDFSHYAPITKEQIKDIEQIVNRNIALNQPVQAQEMEFDQAIKTGAMAIFGEKYGDRVRVITAGDSSKEFCGGCHTSRTGNIGLFKITSEESISAGTRRIEAMTGEAALAYVQEQVLTLDRVSKALKTSVQGVEQRLEEMEQKAKEREAILADLMKKAQAQAAKEALSQVQEIGGVKFLAQEVEGEVDLRSQAEQIKKQLGSGLVALAKKEEGKITVALAVSDDLAGRLGAGSLIKELSGLVGGRGGGKPDFAQCGGTLPEGWDAFKEQLAAKLG